ncbi:unnamed protein product [Musa acuminata var. zebrina]
MAANKFATVLHRNGNKIAVVLAHAVLEWTLILLLLLNGLFAYLIARFADFFGLKPPCVFCSRVDHYFEHRADGRGRRQRGACRDLLCDEHAAEVAGMGYCARHQRLAEAGDMCEDCCPSSSRPVEAAVLSWMKRSEEGAKDLRCSCCDVVIESGFYSPYLFFKPYWDVSDNDQKGNSVEEIAVGDREEGFEEDAIFGREKVKKWELVPPDPSDRCHEKEEDDDEEKVGRKEATCAADSERAAEEQEEEEALIQFSDVCCLVDDPSFEVLTRRLGNICDDDEERLVPVQLIDSATMTKSPASFVLSKQRQQELGLVGGEKDGGVVDIGSIAEERKPVAFAAERTDAMALDIGSITEKNGLDSFTKMADIVEVNPLGNVGAVQEAKVLDVGCVMEEVKPLASDAGSDDIFGENCSVDVAADQHADDVDMRSMETEVSAGEAADTVTDNSSDIHEAQQCAMTVDERSISEEKALPSSKQKADTIEESSSEMDGAQQLTITGEEKALASSEERAHTIVENFSEMNGVQQCEITLDTGSVLEDEKIPLSRMEGDDIVKQNSIYLHASSDHQTIAPQATSVRSLEDVVQVESLRSAEDLPETKDFEEDNKLIDVDTGCGISTGSEICNQENSDHAHPLEPILLSERSKDQLSESYNEMTTIDQEILVTETEPMVVTAAQRPDHVAVFADNNEIEEERVPETPTYLDGIHGLIKSFFLGRRESGTESLDGSVAGEFEGCDTLTVDQLKAALKAEQKALSALYTELEEERSASAIAANQTMAMITRLQQEKAAMQMEALQYQRMMEEQSDYDQEALQLLNELMMKREKEKQDLEKELEVYRKKILRYKAKERRQTAKHKVNGIAGTFSTSSSAEDSDDLSFEVHEGNGFAYDPDENNQNTLVDDVLSSGANQGTATHTITLRESLDDFEEERLSILEQLKALESELLTLDDEDSHDSDAIEHITHESCHVSNGNYGPSCDDLHDDANGLSVDLEASRNLHGEQRSSGCNGKRLLPLFDAISEENEAAVDASTKTNSNLAEKQKKLAIVEELDNIHERLHALEGDREFIKHCIGSLKKGDKGIHLLQEILEHLRDLRSVELRARNSCNALVSLMA